MDSVATVTLPQSEEPLSRLVRGDAAAFAEIVHEHQSMVFSLAYHFLHDRGRAEEVAQDVFLRLYRRLEAIKTREHLVHWLRQVTCRRAIDEVRKLPKAPATKLEDVAEPATEAENSDPFLTLRLQRVVASLPEDARAVIVLRYQEELELAEIAEILEIPINTVKSRLQRSLEMLRKKLQSWVGEKPL